MSTKKDISHKKPQITFFVFDFQSVPFLSQYLLPLGLMLIRPHVGPRQILVGQSMQMFSGNIARLTKSGHTFLRRELIRTILKRYNRLGYRFIQIRIMHIRTAINGSRRITTRTKSSHAALTRELVRATLQRYNGVGRAQLSHGPFPTPASAAASRLTGGWLSGTSQFEARKRRLRWRWRSLMR